MTFNKFKILTSIICLFALFINVFGVLAVSDDVGIDLEVDTGVSVCDNDGVCESGENESNCPNDCGCNNNGTCESARGENESNCSNDCYVPPPSVPPGTPADLIPPTVYNLSVKEITLTSAVIEWDVTEYALCQLFWGLTTEYEKESITETDYSVETHSTSLLNLSLATTYHFKIACQDRAGNQGETTDQRFSTLFPPDITPPANVLNFEAIPGDSQITLVWQNPPDKDFNKVRIIRSTTFYPADPFDGIPVYNQDGTSFVDEGLNNGVRYYYTAFAYDKAGNYSSGAVVSAVPFKEGVPIPPPEELTTEENCIDYGYYWHDDTCHKEPKIVPPEEVPPEIKELTLGDFDFWQENKKLPLIEGRLVEAKAEPPLTISIDYEKVPEVLKTIMITLTKGEKIFSFLLRINEDKTKYLATLMPPDEGDYPLTVAVLDYKNQALKGIPGELTTRDMVKPLPTPIPWHIKYWPWLVLLLIFILAIIFFLILRKRGKETREEKQRFSQVNQPYIYHNE